MPTATYKSRVVVPRLTTALNSAVSLTWTHGEEASACVLGPNDENTSATRRTRRQNCISAEEPGLADGRDAEGSMALSLV